MPHGKLKMKMPNNSSCKQKKMIWQFLLKSIIEINFNEVRFVIVTQGSFLLLERDRTTHDQNLVLSSTGNRISAR